MREAIETFRNKFRERKADIPIYVAVGGPLSITVALQMADGIITTAGVAGLGLLKARAKEMGRDFATIPVVDWTGSFAISYNKKEALDAIKGPLARTIRSRFINHPSPFPPELERFREEAQRIAEGYDYFNHMRSHTPEGQLARHAQLMSDELAETLGIAGTPEEVLPKLKALWRAVAPMPNVSLCFTPYGSNGGRKRSFELFVREVLPKLG